MIVNIAGWLYIINAGLSLLGLLGNPFWQIASRSGLTTLVLAGLIGALGYGLLKREPWARWWALGASLLAWTIGSVLLIVVVVYLLAANNVGQYFAMLFSGGFMAGLMFIVLLTVLVWLASIVISFKLFWYLCSQEGCEEFGVPYGSAGTVVASCGAWIAIGIFNAFSSGGAHLLYELGVSGVANQERQESRAREYAREREETLARDERAAELRAEAEAQTEESAEEGDYTEEDAESGDEPEMIEEPQVIEEPRLIEESPAPVLSAASDAGTTSETEEPASKRVLKCRDASGGITFTQGYCPPGSKQVDMSAQ